MIFTFNLRVWFMFNEISNLKQDAILYEYIKSHGKLIKPQLKRIEQTIDKALKEHPRVLAIRVDLHIPNCEVLNDIPTEYDFARTDAAVISRFTASLKENVKHHLIKQGRNNKRVRGTSLRFVWAREFCPSNNKKHYHVLLLLNRDTFHTLVTFNNDSVTILQLIRKAWMSAVNLIYPRNKELVVIPENPCYYLNAKDGKGSDKYKDVIFRTSYFAKEKSKCFTDGSRNFGYSQV